MEPQIGATYGPYVVEEVIARGGQGLVLKTRHSQRGIPAALKILFDKSDLARGRFLREIETLRLLADHPGLPAPYDLGEHEGTLFIALEFVEGRSLHDMVRSGGPLPETQALEFVAKTARIVAQCHERGVLHRDLKPANVVIRSESGAPCVVDFGVARVEGKGVSDASRLSMTGDLIGTPAFMAPEQVSGEGVGPHTDVYGLGAILFFLLSGEKPVSGATTVNIMTRLARDATPDVREANPAVSAATAELLLRAMAKEPQQRIPSAAVFAEELDALADAEPKASSPSKLALGLGALVLLALLGGGLALAFRAGDPDPSSPATTPSPSPQASEEPSPTRSRPALPPQEPGTPTWSATFPNSAVLSHVPLGPFAVVESAPVEQGKARRKLLETHLVSLDDGSRVASLPEAELWCWDAPRRRALAYEGGRLLSVSPTDPEVRFLAEDVGQLCSLGASGDRIYTSRPHLLEIRDAKGQVLRPVPIPGHLEAPPLELDLDPSKPGPDHLLVTTTESAALLLTLDGRRSGSPTDLPGPVSTQPVVLSAKPESAEIGIVSGAGVLTRLVARSKNLRLLESYDLGGTPRGVPFQPRGPLLVDRDAQGAARQVFLHLLSGIACLSPDLAQLRWRAGHPAGGGRFRMTGLAQSDLDRNGIPELLATFVNSGRSKGPRQLTHLLFGPRGRALQAGPLHLGPRSGRSLPEGALLLTRDDDTLVRWGPWKSLPDADPALEKPPRPGRALAKAAALRLSRSTTAKLRLHKTNAGPPFQARFMTKSRAGGKIELEVTGSKGVHSVWFQGQYLGEGKTLVIQRARIDLNFLLLKGQRPPGEAWLELDLLVKPNFGPAFAEFAFVVNERPRVRTVRAFHRKGGVQVPLGEINEEGMCSIQVHLTSRSRVLVRVKSARLFFREG